jgi:hypothetical protein
LVIFALLDPDPGCDGSGSRDPIQSESGSATRLPPLSFTTIFKFVAGIAPGYESEKTVVDDEQY